MEEEQQSTQLNDIRKQLNTACRGFASMDPERQRAIASQGGRAAHENGRAHKFNSEEAREAGQKGGEKVSRDREYMAEIGRRGGRSSGEQRRRSGNEPN
ncbi:MAG TPA: KGG domain-containing protein [Chitinophagaceae bacterium]|nr:KGG domain-containing protein [Chitinophagaceae bacterium]